MDKDEEEDMNDVDEGEKHNKYFPEVGENLEEEVKYKNDSFHKYLGVSLFKPDVGCEPLDGKDALIYSIVESVGPYSFVDWRQDYDDKSPPPTYLAYEHVNPTLPTEYDELFAKFEFCK